MNPYGHSSVIQPQPSSINTLSSSHKHKFCISKCWKLPFHGKNECPALERKKGTLKRFIFQYVVYRHMSMNRFCRFAERKNLHKQWTADLCVRLVLYLHKRLRVRRGREKVSTVVTQHACVCVCVRGRGNWACGVLFRESPFFEWGNLSFSMSGTWAITPFRCQLTALYLSCGHSFW